MFSLLSGTSWNSPSSSPSVLPSPRPRLCSPSCPPPPSLSSPGPTKAPIHHKDLGYLSSLRALSTSLASPIGRRWCRQLVLLEVGFPPAGARANRQAACKANKMNNTSSRCQHAATTKHEGTTNRQEPTKKNHSTRSSKHKPLDVQLALLLFSIPSYAAICLDIPSLPPGSPSTSPLIPPTSPRHPLSSLRQAGKSSG